MYNVVILIAWMVGPFYILLGSFGTLVWSIISCSNSIGSLSNKACTYSIFYGTNSLLVVNALHHIRKLAIPISCLDFFLRSIVLQILFPKCDACGGSLKF